MDAYTETVRDLSKRLMNEHMEQIQEALHFEMPIEIHTENYCLSIEQDTSVLYLKDNGELYPALMVVISDVEEIVNVKKKSSKKK